MAKLIIRAGKIGALAVLPLTAVILILLLIVYPQTSSQASQEAASQLEQGRTLLASQDYDGARTVFQGIVNTYPDEEQAVWAQSELARMELKLRNNAAAEAVIGNLKTEYAANQLAAHALHDIAFRYYAMKKYEEARDLYQYVVQNYAGNEYEVMALGGLIVTEVNLGNIAEGDAAAVRILNDFAGNQYMAVIAHDIATAYSNAKDYQKTKLFFEYSLANNPGPEHGMWSRIGLAKADIRLGLYSQAQAIVEQLLSSYSADARLPNEINEIAKYFKRAGRETDAQVVYGKAFTHLPSSSYADEGGITCLRAYIYSLIEAGDVATARQATDGILTEFQTDDQLASVLTDIATKFESVRDLAEATRVHEMIIKNCPNSPQAQRSEFACLMIVVASSIRNGACEGVEEIIDGVLENYPDIMGLPYLISRMPAEQYYIEANRLYGADPASAKYYYQKALALWDLIRAQYPSSDVVDECCYFGAICNRRLGNYDQAINLCIEVVNEHPEYHRAWHALFMIGETYESMKKAGLVGADVADPMTRGVYSQLMQNYPECKVANIALAWLNSHDSN